eukprot:2051750-Amphidinium_carterae.1
MVQNLAWELWRACDTRPVLHTRTCTSIVSPRAISWLLTVLKQEALESCSMHMSCVLVSGRGRCSPQSRQWTKCRSASLSSAKVSVVQSDMQVLSALRCLRSGCAHWPYGGPCLLELHGLTLTAFPSMVSVGCVSRHTPCQVGAVDAAKFLLRSGAAQDSFAFLG